jgi:hypothetical protein
MTTDHTVRVNFDACVYDPSRGQLTVRTVDLDPACDADVVEVGVFFGSLTHVLRFDRTQTNGCFRLSGISNIDPAFGDEDWMDRIHTLVVEG